MITDCYLPFTGGLQDFLNQNSDVSVYMLSTFPETLKSQAKNMGASVIEVSDHQEIMTHVYSTGEMSSGIAGLTEQSLVFDTPNRLVIITGCAHPGIVGIVEKSMKITGKNVHLVFGGFHLKGMNTKDLKKVISALKKLQVQKVGPSHCTGEKAIELFKETWGDDYIDLGCGAVFTIENFE